MNGALMGLIFSTLLILVVFILINTTKKRGQIKTFFSGMLICLLICCICLMFQILFSNKYNLNPIYFDCFVYIGSCFLPVFFFLFSIAFKKTRFIFTRAHLLLFIIPVLSLILLWTNNYHHLFYKVYSTNINESVFGMYFYIYSIYTYALYAIGLFNFIRYTIKNSGFFSKQAILILIGSLFPIIINLLGFIGVITISIYITPITFTLAIFCYAIAIFKFDFLKIAPIALQRIVDRMSDRIYYC